jgi:uncharacterized protein YdeI (BOF family)
MTSDRFLTKERSMRKTFILSLVLCVFAAIAYAQTGSAPTGTGTSTTTSTTTSTSGTSGTATTTTTTKTHHKKSAAKKCTFSGTVASVDQAGKSFVVHPKKGEDVTLKVNDKTKYSPAKTCSWDDIKVDGKVSGTCKKDGADTWAVTVKCSKAKAAKPAASTGTGTMSTGTGTGK